MGVEPIPRFSRERILSPRSMLPANGKPVLPGRKKRGRICLDREGLADHRYQPQQRRLELEPRRSDCFLRACDFFGQKWTDGKSSGGKTGGPQFRCELSMDALNSGARKSSGGTAQLVERLVRKENRSRALAFAQVLLSALS
jgi:hypothetical protein